MKTEARENLALLPISVISDACAMLKTRTTVFQVASSALTPRYNITTTPFPHHTRIATHNLPHTKSPPTFLELA